MAATATGFIAGSEAGEAGLGSECVIAALQVLQQFIRQDGHNGTDSASCSSSSEAGEATPDDEDEPQEQNQGGASRPGTAAHVGPHVTDRLQAASLAEADTHQGTDPAGRAEPGLQQQGGDEPGGHSLGDQQAAGGGDVQEAESPPDHVVLRQVQAARGSEAAGSSPTPVQVRASLLACGARSPHVISGEVYEGRSSTDTAVMRSRWRRCCRGQHCCCSAARFFPFACGPRYSGVASGGCPAGLLPDRCP